MHFLISIFDKIRIFWGFIEFFPSHCVIFIKILVYKWISHKIKPIPSTCKIEMEVAFFSFFIIMISMVIIDGLWLAFMFKRFYAPNMSHLLNDGMIIWPAAIFYILYGIALNIFVVLPALKNNTGYSELLLLGLLFGMVTYGTYDLTNQATLKNWPWMVTVVDIVWGSCLAAAVSLTSTFMTRYFW